jgi:hypothetical protein
MQCKSACSGSQVMLVEKKRDSEDLAKKNCAMHFKAYIS